MTLIVVAANPHFVVQLSDRRLTFLGGGERNKRVASEEENKTILWDLGHSRFFVSYTGLARGGSTTTEELLCEALLESAVEGNYAPSESVHLLSDRLTKWGASRPLRALPATARRLTVVITGLSRLTGQPMPLQALLTNFQVWGSHDEAESWREFSVVFRQPRAREDWPTLVQRFGAYQSVPFDDAESLRDLLRRGKPPRAVEGKMLEMLPKWAARAQGLGRV